MPKLSGKCLCGNIKFNGDTEIKLMANCHCSDCRAATGAAYGTLLFVDEDAIQVTGSPKVFNHKAESGASMEKLFCPDCGSQLFGRNSNRPKTLSIRAGVLDQDSLVKPSVNVFLDSKIDSTPIDPDLKGFPKMPG
ncbi:MAG: GFA family protein [Rhodospirillaceae bacterium]|jgi:hypothetical protein|nr:GFA family protein [Rhodospirillaceae bacterium]MBT5666014.1 GFA family protein [Rhodospirillaceae bacterium]MBT5809601.1 GFA family protein [Rhodospirillaceae bacterium]